MWETIREIMGRLFVPSHREGYIYLISLAIAAAVSSLISSIFAILLVIALFFCLYFFRDPVRVIAEGTNILVAPADGILDKIEIMAPPEELALDLECRWTRVSIFLSIFNVHIQRIPISGKITKLHYRKGAFLNVAMDKNSPGNERQCCVLETSDGFQIPLVQIAGLIARRIVCDLNIGQEVKKGDKYGIIKFGSRVDIYLPEGIEICAQVGQTMIAGETVIARVSTKES
jgi:phosphatidylserine decarboxylase